MRMNIPASVVITPTRIVFKKNGSIGKLELLYLFVNNRYVDSHGSLTAKQAIKLVFVL